MCYTYDYPCAGNMTTEKVCDQDGYNPFFTKSLYYHSSGHGIADWPGPSEADMAVADFDETTWYMTEYPMEIGKSAELLKIWRCDSFRMFNEVAFHELVPEGQKPNCATAETQDLVFASPAYTEANFENTYPYKTEGSAELKDVPTQKTLHFTIIFQSFVFMQVFNQINGRKIFEGEMNVFDGIFKNPVFVLIVLVTIVVQVVMVEVGGKAVKTYPLGMKENLWCLLIGFIELPWGLFIKFLPIKWFACLSFNEEVPEGGIQDLKGVSTLVRSRSKVFKD